MCYALPVDAVANALGDPTRRMILAMLRAQPMPAGAVAERFSISRPAISRHLRVLRECGLVVDQQIGRERVYRVELSALVELRTWIDQLVGGWQHTLDALDTEVRRTGRDRKKLNTTKPHPTANAKERTA